MAGNLGKLVAIKMQHETAHRTARNTIKAVKISIK